MKTFYSNGKKLSEEITEYFKGSVSYSLANKLIRKKDVKVNGIRVKADFKTDAGDKIEVYYDGEDKRADTIIFKDENVWIFGYFGLCFGLFFFFFCFASPHRPPSPPPSF